MDISSASPNRRWFLLGLMFLVVLVYWPTLNHGFVWDDTYIIRNNPSLEKLANIPKFFLSEDTIDESTGYYRPMTYVSFALERAIWGLNPLGYHLTNLLLHALVVLTFYAVVAALFHRERLALLAAGILALHPVASETVNFLSGGRNTLLSACFGLLSLLCYLKNRRLLSLASFTLAIFSKEFALLLPPVLVWYDCRMQREKFRITRYLPYLVPIACYLTLRSFAVQKANFLSELSLSEIAKAPYYVVRFALNMVAPLQLKVLYDVHPGVVSGVVGALLLAGAMAALYRFRKQDDIVFSACWFLIFLLPVINIIPLHTTTQMADRYAYFSLMGFALLLATLICKANGRLAVAGVAVLAIGYGCLDIRLSGFWKNDVAFFTQMTKDAPERFVGFQDLGMGYHQTGDTAHAVQYLEAASARPDITLSFLFTNTYFLWKEGELGKAERVLGRVLELEPYNAEAYVILAMIGEQKGEKALAQSYRDKAKSLVNGIDEIMADRATGYCRNGELHSERNQIKEAEMAFWQALKANPRCVPAMVDMGTLKAGQGDYAAAEEYLKRALAADPANAAAHHNLGVVYQSQGRAAEAGQELIRFREAEAGAGKN